MPPSPRRRSTSYRPMKTRPTMRSIPREDMAEKGLSAASIVRKSSPCRRDRAFFHGTIDGSCTIVGMQPLVAIQEYPIHALATENQSLREGLDPPPSAAGPG